MVVWDILQQTMGVQFAGGAGTRILLLDFLRRKEDTSARIHGLPGLLRVTTEEAVISENGEGDGTRMLMDDRAGPTASIALRERIGYVANIETLLRQF